MPSDVLLDDAAFADDFAVFQHFDRLVDLEATRAVLCEHRIPVRVADENYGEWRETTIMGSPLRPKYWIEIPATDFAKANYVLQDVAEQEITEEEIARHPFADYSTAELKEVVLNEGDWNPEAVVVARRLLYRSGEEVDVAALRAEARARQDAAFAPRRGSRTTIALVTLLGAASAFVLAWLSLLFCVGMLLYYLVGSRRDPKGDRHLDFDAATRQWGLIGLVIVGMAFLLGLVNVFYAHWLLLPSFDFYF